MWPKQARIYVEIVYYQSDSSLLELELGLRGFSILEHASRVPSMTIDLPTVNKQKFTCPWRLWASELPPLLHPLEGSIPGLLRNNHINLIAKEAVITHHANENYDDIKKDFIENLIVQQHYCRKQFEG